MSTPKVTKDSLGEPLRTRQVLSRIILLGFMGLVGFALSMAIYYKSFMGITLALVSLGAAIYFLYILAKAKKELEEAEQSV